jgi:hypothetical protein
MKEYSKADNYQLFMKGFKDGASHRVMLHESIQSYVDGYNLGWQNSCAASKLAQEKYEYIPSVLRDCDMITGGD